MLVTVLLKRHLDLLIAVAVGATECHRGVTILCQQTGPTVVIETNKTEAM